MGATAPARGASVKLPHQRPTKDNEDERRRRESRRQRPVSEKWSVIDTATSVLLATNSPVETPFASQRTLQGGVARTAAAARPAPSAITVTRSPGGSSFIYVDPETISQPDDSSPNNRAPQTLLTSRLNNRSNEPLYNTIGPFQVHNILKHIITSHERCLVDNKGIAEGFAAVQWLLRAQLRAAGGHSWHKRPQEGGSGLTRSEQRLHFSRGLPAKAINTSTSLHGHMKTRMKKATGVSVPIQIRSAVKQGCPLKPYAFNLTLELVLRSSPRWVQGTPSKGDESPRSDAQTTFHSW